MADLKKKSLFAMKSLWMQSTSKNKYLNFHLPVHVNTQRYQNWVTPSMFVWTYFIVQVYIIHIYCRFEQKFYIKLSTYVVYTG